MPVPDIPDHTWHSLSRYEEQIVAFYTRLAPNNANWLIQQQQLRTRQIIHTVTVDGFNAPISLIAVGVDCGNTQCSFVVVIQSSPVANTDVCYTSLSDQPIQMSLSIKAELSNPENPFYWFYC